MWRGGILKVLAISSSLVASATLLIAQTPLFKDGGTSLRFEGGQVGESWVLATLDRDTNTVGGVLAQGVFKSDGAVAHLPSIPAGMDTLSMVLVTESESVGLSLSSLTATEVMFGDDVIEEESVTVIVDDIVIRPCRKDFDPRDPDNFDGDVIGGGAGNSGSPTPTVDGVDGVDDVVGGIRPCRIDVDLIDGNDDVVIGGRGLKVSIDDDTGALDIGTAGQLLKTYHPDGSVSKIDLHDDEGRLIKSAAFTYEADQMVEEKTNFHYDNAGDLVQVDVWRNDVLVSSEQQ